MSKIWAKIVSLFDEAEEKVDQVFTDIEKALLPDFEAMCKQFEVTLGQQGLAILRAGLADVATVIESGGDVGLLISKLVPQVTSQVEDALKQDATNAAHSAVGLIIAAASASLTASNAGTLDSSGKPAA